VERNAAHAQGGYHIFGPDASCAVRSRCGWVSQGESYLLVGELHRRNTPSENGQDITLGRRLFGPVPDHQPSGRLASWIDESADQARIAGREHRLRRDKRRTVLGKDADADLPTPARYECEQAARRVTETQGKADRMLPGSSPSKDPGTPVPEGFKCSPLADGRRVEREALDWCASGRAAIG
jgi:hypothetical protein